MLEVDIPGRGRLELEYLVLDVNGTLTIDGEVPDRVPEVLEELSRVLRIVGVTADTRGTALELAASLGVEMRVVERGAEAAQKLAFVRELGAAHVVAVGNGANDAAMLREVALGICVLAEEGAAAEALRVSDVVALGVLSALRLLENPSRLIATLRH